MLDRGGRAGRRRGPPRKAGAGAGGESPGRPAAAPDGGGRHLRTMSPASLRPRLRLLALGLGLVLLRAAAGERGPGRPGGGTGGTDWGRGVRLRGSPHPAPPGQGTTPCSRGSAWSADLDKCMDCGSCPARPHSDFCLGCAAAPPTSFRLLWPILGGALGLLLVLGLLATFLVWKRCRRREKFTTPIEETGGEACPGVALIQ
ncbi:tumor necrosis factor receptor superfamily member 12A isoform X1 [Erinaceus europaeus]|uniref:Tumor necrosis factor receptor superfamily member 12A isoform X1 n=1 Tax=Erinaceus europaeus TaxID=9365 RepID=A0ABM3VVZ1_ERIEU|nr:tumor necrosis factor receptor superfamily member 12A isoform X1 [Erinaceus europaeus]